MPAWHEDLPQTPQRDGFTMGYERPVWEFQADVGRPIRGRRQTDSRKWWAGAYRMTEAQLATFWTFWNSTINTGLDSFTMTDPNTFSTVTVEMFDSSPPEPRAFEFDAYDVPIKVRVLS